MSQTDLTGGLRGGAAARRPWLPPELRVRALSGVLLAALALGFNLAGATAFSLIISAIAVIMAWEWGRLVRGSEVDAAMIAHAVAVVVGCTLAVIGRPALGLVALAIGAVVIIPLRFGERSRLSAFGVPYVGVPAIALIWLRDDGSGFGFTAVLLVLVAVWSTDTFAFVVGRAIGGPRLWPSISPNKTWAGLIGGVVAAAVTAALFAPALEGGSPVYLGSVGAVLGAVSQGGDLAESALKRAFSAKDTSALIPGHGGFMDRLDGMVTAATMAAIIGIALGAEAPARALLLGG
jgi:phosphatidate cytidylyltransferase